MAETIEIRLNGTSHDVAASSTLVDLVTTLGRKPELVAIERNGEIVPRDQYAATVLETGDQLEVVHFVQGGTIGQR